MTRFEIRTKLLQAISACTDPNCNPRIDGIVFRDNEIIATDGRMLVRVPAKHSLSVMVPIEIVDAACAASLAGSDGQVDEYGYPVDDKNSMFIWEDEDGLVRIDIGGGVHLCSSRLDITLFPDIEKVSVGSTRKGNPMNVRFDPGRMQKFDDVMQALGDRAGARIVACGGPTDALVMRSDSGATFTLMPMQPKESDAQEAA